MPTGVPLGLTFMSAPYNTYTRCPLTFYVIIFNWVQINNKISVTSVTAKTEINLPLINQHIKYSSQSSLYNNPNKHPLFSQSYTIDLIQNTTISTTHITSYYIGFVALSYLSLIQISSTYFR